MSAPQLLTATGAYTLADFDAWPESTLIELHEGSIVVNPHPLFGHQQIVERVAAWLRAHRPPQLVYTGGVGIAFRRELESGFIPDITVLASHAAPEPDRLWLRPDEVELVVEVLSPSTRSRDLTTKHRLYWEFGLVYWIVDTREATITVVGQTDLNVADAIAAVFD